MNLQTHLKEVSKQNKLILNKLVEEELNKIFKTDYYGTKEQIFNEKVIMEKTG
jgi:hypothetical protein